MAERHYYSWDDAFSTDPTWKPTGQDHKVFCNDVEYHAVLRCLTGKGGFVERVKRDSNGAVIIHDHLVREFFAGDVRIEWEGQEG